MLNIRRISAANRILVQAALLLALAIASTEAFAQTTAFTYQGKLTDNNVPANALYDFTLTLWDAPTNGTQIGSAVTLLNTPVVDGIFTVTLDFGAGAFNGAGRYLEISVKPSGNPAVPPTLLAPRQQVVATPYAIKSLGAMSADSLSVACVNCVTSGQIQSVSASQVTTGTLAVARGGTGLGATGAAGNYLRSNGANWTSSPVFASDIGGTLSVSKGGTGLSAAGATGNFLRSNGTSWTSSPLQASDVPDLGSAYIKNSLALQSGANFNISGNGTAGGTLSANIIAATTQYNLGGSPVLRAAFDNTFVGFGAGSSNTLGARNSFFGKDAGKANTQGHDNTFLGFGAGFSNLGGSNNIFLGSESGFFNDGGVNNVFIGNSAGSANTSGFDNTFIGTSNVPKNTTGSNNTTIGSGADVGSNNLIFATAIGSASTVLASNTIALGRTSGIDKVVVYGLGSGGSTQLCRNASNQIATCSSSLRYKTDVQTFAGGLDIVNRLRPIAFTWKAGGMRDLGFGAEEVAAVEPLLTFNNEKGEIEGVKYDRISVALVNAVREQQTQIEKQNDTIKRQQAQIETLKKVVCLDHPEAEMCKP